MLELAYFELNPDFNPADLGDIAADLMNADAWPTEGVNLLGWWITPDFGEWPLWKWIVPKLL